MAGFVALLLWRLFQKTTFTYFTETDLEWQQALDFCRGQGQELIRVTSQAEHDFLTSLIQEDGVWGKASRDDIWSSLHARDPANPSAGFQWQLVHPPRCLPLEPESWIPWDRDHHNVDQEHSCVQLKWSRGNKFKWETTKCREDNRVICRKDKGKCESYEVNGTHAVKPGSSEQRELQDEEYTKEQCLGACSQEKVVNGSSCYAAEWSTTGEESSSCILHLARGQFTPAHLEPRQKGSGAATRPTLLHLRKCFHAVLNTTKFDLDIHKQLWFNRTCPHNTSATTTTGDQEASSSSITPPLPPPSSSPAVTTLQQTTQSHPSSAPSTTSLATTSSVTFDTTAPSGDPAVATSEIPTNTSGSGIFNASAPGIPNTTVSKIAGIIFDNQSTAPTFETETVRTSMSGILTTSEIVNATTSGILTPSETINTSTSGILPASENVDANTWGMVTPSDSVHTTTTTSSTSLPLTSPPPHVTVTTPPKVSREGESSSSSTPTDNSEEETMPLGATSTDNAQGSSPSPAHNKRQHPAILCPCATCVRINATERAEQRRILSHMLKTLAVDHKNTTLFKRKYTSAPDPRRSAQMIGCLGLVVLVIVLAVFVITDAIGLWCSRVQRVGALREKARKAGKSE